MSSLQVKHKIHKFDSYEELSKMAAYIIKGLIMQKPKANLGLATGSTPVGLYKELINDYQHGLVSFKQVHTFNLDEYIGLELSHQQSYHYYMNDILFKNIDIPNENIHIPSGVALNKREECTNYEILIKKYGGIDLQVLGLGLNGHIGFNEPGTSFKSRTHIVKLAESTRLANARFFNHRGEVPKQAITMGIQTIMEAKQLLLMAFGEEKMKPIERLLNEDVSIDFPASVLKTHPNVTILYGT